jgi:hypothetical protein
MAVAEIEVQECALQHYEIDGELDAAILPEPGEWWLTPVDGGGMQRVNLPTFYSFGGAIRMLRPINTSDKITDRAIILNMYSTKVWLSRFNEATSGIAFPHSREAAEALIGLIDQYVTKLDESLAAKDSESTFQHHYLVKLKAAIKDFELLFDRESRRASVFAVTPKGIYDIQDLIERAQDSLPPDVKGRLDVQATYDIQQAGKCLAFDINTAAGIHILKAVESLIRAYHAKVTGKTLTVKSRNWGAHIRDLNNAGADQRVTSYLQHIKDFYRNPIMHPEVVLTPDEAFSLFNASLSAIVQLDAAIQAWP